MFLGKVGDAESFHCVATAGDVEVEFEADLISHFMNFLQHLVCLFGSDVFVFAQRLDCGHSIVGRCVWINAECVKFYGDWFSKIVDGSF